MCRPVQTLLSHWKPPGLYVNRKAIKNLTEISWIFQEEKGGWGWGKLGLDLVLKLPCVWCLQPLLHGIGSVWYLSCFGAEKGLWVLWKCLSPGCKLRDQECPLELIRLEVGGAGAENSSVCFCSRWQISEQDGSFWLLNYKSWTNQERPRSFGWAQYASVEIFKVCLAMTVQWQKTKCNACNFYWLVLQIILLREQSSTNCQHREFLTTEDL